MPAKAIQASDAPPARGQAHHVTFFRQSGWMMITAVGSGGLMMLVHFFSKLIPTAEYRNMETLFAIMMAIPAIPLQMVFTHQSALALANDRVRQLAGMIRLAWIATFAVCVLAGVVLLFEQSYFVALWKLSNPAALWVTLAAVLLTLWMPMFCGLMQGQQNFLWLGWSQIIHGIGRVGSAAVIVLVLTGYATGIMSGVVIGLAAATAVGIWQTRGLWALHAAPFDWWALLKEILPLFFGFGATQFIFTGDTLFVNHYLPDQGAYYGAAGTLSRALVWLVGPLTGVMFPKIVHSTARAEKSNLLGLTLACSAVLALVGAAGLWVLGPWVVPVVYPRSYLPVTLAVLPWYAGAMLPLCLANVLVNNLLAQSRFRIVPILVVMAVAYGLTLTQIHDTLIHVLQVLGSFNLVLLAICAAFTWGGKGAAPNSARA